MKLFYFVLVFIFLFTFNTYAQNTSNNPSTYYPLTVGNVWKYHDIGGTSRVEVTEYSERNDSYLIYDILKSGNLQPLTSKKILEIRGNTVLLLAAQGAFGGNFKQYNPAKIILEFPLAVGKAWDKSSLEGNKESCNVVEFLKKFRVKGGDFENVWKIKCINYFGSRYDYYAPNVGLIKQEVGESPKARTMKELLKYEVR